MDSIAAQVDAALSDARRAALPGAIGDATDRPGTIIAAPIAGMRGQFAPSASPLSVAIDGPGMFVLDDHGKRVYGRLGDFAINSRGALVDGHGRFVLGTISSVQTLGVDRLAAIQSDAAKRRSDFRIDANGVVCAFTDGKQVTIGRIAIAVFPAAERMARVGETAALATHASGKPHFHFPGDVNVGALRSHALESGLVDLQGDLARAWRLRKRGELAAAVAYASDECVRDGLGLVK